MKSICLVGIGGYAARQLKIIQMFEREKRLNLHSIVVRDRKKYAKEVDELRDFNVVIYPSYKKMLAYGRDKIDLIALPIALMDLTAYSIMALESGYDVIVEKPAAITLQDADKLIQTEKETGRYLIIGYQFTYSSSISLILNGITSGEFGKVTAVKVLCGWSRGWNYYKNNNWLGHLVLDGKWVLDGPLTNANSHFLNNAMMILNAANSGVAVKSVRAELYRSNDIASYDTCSLKVEMTDDARLFFVASHAINKSIDPIMEIETEKASISWDFVNEKTVIRYKGRHKKIFKERHPEHKYENVLSDAIAVAVTRLRRPNSTMEIARPQVLVSNLAFESAEDIVTIPKKALKTASDKYGKKTYIKDMESILTNAYENTTLFSEMDISWAKATKEVSANGYTTFPQSDKLKALMKND